MQEIEKELVISQWNNEKNRDLKRMIEIWNPVKLEVGAGHVSREGLFPRLVDALKPSWGIGKLGEMQSEVLCLTLSMDPLWTMSVDSS